MSRRSANVLHASRESIRKWTSAASQGSFRRLKVEALESRRLLSVSGGPQRLFAVPQDGSADIVELNASTGAEINRFAAPAFPTHGPDGLAFNGTSLFYLNGIGTLWELDPDTGATIDSDTINGGSGNFDGLGAVGGNVYILDHYAGDVVIFNPATDTVTGVLDINGANPGVNIVGGLSGITGPNALIATVGFGSSVVEINPVTGVVTNSFTPMSGNSVYGVAVVGGELYLGRNSGGVIDVYSRSGVFQRSVGPLPYSFSALGGDGLGEATKRLFAIPLDSSADIVELNATTGAEINRFIAPLAPSHGSDGLAYNGASLFYLNGGGALWELNPDTGAIIDADLINGGSGSFDGLATIGDNVYILDSGASDIVVFDPAADTVTGILDVNGLNPGVNIVGGLSGIAGPNALIATVGLGSSIVEINPATGLVTNTFGPMNAGILGVAVVDGEIYLGRNSGGVIEVYSRGGVFQRSIGPLPYSFSALGGDDAGGTAAPGEIRGSKWNDSNGNGIWEQPVEPGLPGWVIFLDANNNGILDGEIATTTDAYGNYAFTGLPAGTYRVAEFMLPGWTQTYPNQVGTERLFTVRANDSSATIYELNPNNGSVLHSFSAPGAGVNSGPQGLALGPNTLFYIDGTGGMPHTLWELNPDTGAVIDFDVVDAMSPSDIAGAGYLNGKIYLERYSLNQILVWDPFLDAPIMTLDVPAELIGGLTGATDLGVLFDSNSAGNIFKIDPTTGAVLATLSPGVGSLIGGLAYVNGELIASDWSEPATAYRINPSTGAVLGNIALGGTGPVSGLGGDGAAGLFASELIVNGGFETGDFFGWTINTPVNPLAPWAVTPSGAGGYFSLTSPPEGLYDAWNGFDGGGPIEFTMYQDVTIPAGTDVTLSWKGRAQWNVNDQARTLQVQVHDPVNNAILATVYSFSTTGAAGDTGWQSHSVDLSTYAGSSVRIYFVEDIPQFYTGAGQIEFDAISLTASSSAGSHIVTLGGGQIVTDINFGNTATPLPSIAISPSPVAQAEGNFGGTPFAFWVTLSAPSAQTVTVSYFTLNSTASAGSDYQPVMEVLTFMPGQTARQITVLVYGDEAVETDEDFLVTLSNPTNATLVAPLAIGTIQNDDPLPSMAIVPEAVAHAEGNSGTTPFVFTVTLSAPSGQTATVSYVTQNATATASNSDYQPVMGTLTFLPGQTARQITVLVHGDSTYEADEDFMVWLSNPMNAMLSAASAIGTIQNDDPPPLLTLGSGMVAQAEGNSGTTPYVFTVTLSASSGQMATVSYGTTDGTATTSDGDYQPVMGVLTFSPGQTAQQITVLVNGDTTYEADEDYTFWISNPTNATLDTASAIGTIQNDEAPPFTITGRHLFYNQSGASTRYDGNNLAINASDDAAIATDKTAYLWENPGAATFANVSSYTKGINGIMVDISGSHPNISADDFIFRVGNNNSPGTWATANAPTSISVRAGAGVGGSDRVEIIWNTGAPFKQWLEVIVLANADTGLPQKVGHPAGHADAFFFASAPGNTGAGDSVANALVSSADEAGIRANPAGPASNIPLTNVYDVNRNGQVNSADESAARLNGTNPATTLKYLNLTTAPAAPEAASVDEEDGGEEVNSGVASALTATATTSGEISVPKWILNRVDSIDLNSGAPARLFQYLHDSNSLRSRALLQKFDSIADALRLDDELLDELLADLGLE